MKSKILVLLILFLVGCKDNSVEPEQIKEKVLKNDEVIFFSSDRDGKATNLFMMSNEGEIIKQITKYEWGEYVATAISPDCNQLLFYQSNPGLDIEVGMDIYIYKIKEDSIIGPIANGTPGNFSPDGLKFVFDRHTFTVEGGFESVYLFDLRDSSEVKLTEDGKTSFYPKISPDGKNICYETASLKQEPLFWQLCLMDINGNYKTNLTESKSFYWAGNGVFTPDGNSVVFYYNEQTWCYDICKVDITTKAIEYLTENRVHGRYDITSDFKNPNVSPDGKKVYFYSSLNDYQYPHPCDIYSVNIDGTDLKNITNNSTWDSHPVSGTVSYYVD